ncbi:trypsin-like serine peptidase [Nocardiopsis composta]
MTPSLARSLLAPLAAAVLAATMAGAPASAAPAPRADPPAEVVRHSAEESPRSPSPTGPRSGWPPPARSPGCWRARPAACSRRALRTPPRGGAAPAELRGHREAVDRRREGRPGHRPGLPDHGGRDFTCTASVVPSDNGDTVVTAGHCLKDGTGDWASKWVFVPGYDDGEAPYGRFAARELLVTSQWSRRADDSHDFGAAVLEAREGRHVRQATGAQRIAFTGKGAGTVHAFGYPSRSPYDGRHLYYCSGPTRPDDGGTTAHGMACDMTEGSSGGPWLSGFDPSTGTGTVVSVVSFKYAGRDGVQYGPVLGSSERAVYDRARAL